MGAGKDLRCVKRQHFLGLDVLFNVQLDVFTDPDSSDLHHVEGECSSLVRADVGSTSHDLAGSQLLHIVVVLEHFTLRVGE